jgi:ABC-2 type transport system ATP-binding protein
VGELCARRHDRYRLQIRGDPNGFLEGLSLEGVKILHDNGQGELRVAVPADWGTRDFFKLADVHDVLLRGLQQDDEDLEELFHRVIDEQGG